MKENINLTVDKIIELGNLSLNFAKTNRFTLHQDGVRPESDTDHTFMLALLGCSLANSFYKDKLDIGLVSQFAMIHDLVEVYAEDTDTLVNNSVEAKKEKQERERKSIERIKEEFGSRFPYIHETIEKYEAQDTKEARFIKILDKILPRITNILNGSASNKKRKTKEEYALFLEGEMVKHEIYREEFPEVLSFFDEINKRTLDAF